MSSATSSGRDSQPTSTTDSSDSNRLVSYMMIASDPQPSGGRPARVLHVIDTGGPGGAETVLDTIVGHLPPAEWQSRVVVPVEDWLFGRLTARGVDVAVLPSERAADLRYLRGLVRQIRDFRPHVVHAHLLGAGVYGSTAALLAGDAPVVCTFHGRPDVSPSDRFLPLKARLISRRRNRIVYVSHDLRGYLEPLLGVSPDLGSVVHNGIDFREPRPTGSERLGCGAGPGEPLIGAVGNIRPAKDYETLLRAAAIVREARPDARFAIVGDERSPLTPALKRLASRIGLETSLRFLGFREDAATLVAAFDVFVSSSRTEGLPLGTVEAVGLGTPVVLTNVGGVPEVVDHGRTGLLVPPGDAAALARGILETLAHPDRARAMAEIGARDVRERFAAARMCERYQSLYRALGAPQRADGAGSLMPGRSP